jgi:uncharacterized protein (TIGR02246 family)
MRKPLTLLSLLLAATACSMGNKAASDSTNMAAGDSMKSAMPADDNAAKDAIAKVRSAWKEGSDKKDAAGVAALYSDDAILVGTDIPPASGKAEIQTRLGQMFSMSSVGSIDTKETAVGGDIAYDYGTFHQTITPPKGKPMDVNGAYIVTLHKQADGSWKITHHISNIQPAKP